MKVVCIDTAINIRRLSRQILKNEPKIIEKYPSTSDGGTNLGINSLTSRFCHFNILDWWGTKSLKKCIREGYEEYTKIIDTPLYVQCWANVMRKNEKIDCHSHSISKHIGEHHHLCGNLCVKVDGSISTYYDGNPILNKEGQMSFFAAYVDHWTDAYRGNEERITVAFDILSEFMWENDIVLDMKSHWVRI